MELDCGVMCKNQSREGKHQITEGRVCHAEELDFVQCTLGIIKKVYTKQQFRSVCQNIQGKESVLENHCVNQAGVTCIFTAVSPGPVTNLAHRKYVSIEWMNE